MTTTSAFASTDSFPIGAEHRAILADRDPRLQLYTASVAEQGARFASVIAAGNWDAPVATCPGWDLHDLLKHVGMVHLWAAANIQFPSRQWLSINQLSDLAPYWPELTAEWPDDGGLVTWYRATLANLLRVMDEHSDDHQCLTFLDAPSPMIMWARRQASEIAIHRHDAALAAGVTSDFPPRFALDMLDELLAGFAVRMRPVPDARPSVLRVDINDINQHYSLTLDPAGNRISRTAADFDLRISGTAADLYTFMWNRPAGSSIALDGDSDVLDLWRETCRVQWL